MKVWHDARNNISDFWRMYYMQAFQIGVALGGTLGAQTISQAAQANTNWETGAPQSAKR